MSEQTKIAWCDSTLNFWEGCAKVSAGCANCYAEARDKRFTGGKLWGKGAPRRKSKSAVKDAMKYNKLPWICGCQESAKTGGFSRDIKFDGEAPLCCECGQPCHRRRIFSLSLGDIWDSEATVEMVHEALYTIWQCDQVTWMLCSKRWENWLGWMEAVKGHELNIPRPNGKNTGSPIMDEYHPFYHWLTRWTDGKPPKNIILIASVENQPAADKRIPELLKIPAACRGLSMEPLLGPVDISRSLPDYPALEKCDPWIDWLIIGGESGANARPCQANWIHSLIEQGQAAGVATFCKQLGSHSIWHQDGDPFHKELKDKKGADSTEWPIGFRVQEWPKGF